MSLLRIRERIAVLAAEQQLPGGDHSQHITGSFFELLTGGHVIHERRTSEKEGALPRKHDRIERRHGAAGTSEQNEIAPRAEDLEILVERRLPDAVVDDVDSKAAGQPLGLSLEVLLGIEDHLVSAGLAGQLRLLPRANRTDDARA